MISLYYLLLLFPLFMAWTWNIMNQSHEKIISNSDIADISYSIKSHINKIFTSPSQWNPIFLVDTNKKFTSCDGIIKDIQKHTLQELCEHFWETACIQHFLYLDDFELYQKLFETSKSSHLIQINFIWDRGRTNRKKLLKTKSGQAFLFYIFENTRYPNLSFPKNYRDILLDIDENRYNNIKK